MFCSVCRPFSLLLLASGSCALTSHLLIYFIFSRWCKHTNNNRPCNHFGLFMLILCSVLLLLDWCEAKSICIHTDIRTVFSHWLKEWEKDVQNEEKKNQEAKRSTTKQQMKEIKNFVNTLHIQTHIHLAHVWPAQYVAHVVLLLLFIANADFGYCIQFILILLLFFLSTFIKCFQFANFWTLF